jgi:methionyl-tRNA formyltransferase
MRAYALATVLGGWEMTKALAGEGFPLAAVIGLSDRPRTDAIAGFVPVATLAPKIGVPAIEVQDYSLKSDDDRRLLSGLEIDLLLVLGWQRLVPTWLIERCRLGVIGMHGSASGISAGRGRSPQNWALMLGKDAFHLSIFFIDPGIDSGDVITSQEIPLSPHDDIKSCHYKVGRASVEMIMDAWRSGAFAEKRATPQTGPFKYMPQRTPDDGAIDWSRSTQHVYDFIRALSRPYPGAFTRTHDGALVRLWRARPFVTRENLTRFVPGEVIAVLEMQDMLVRTADGAILIDEYEAGAPLKAGDRLVGDSFQAGIARIAERHRAKFPDLPLADDIVDQLP